MDALAPTTGPRNLAPHVAEWLRTQGFSAVERVHASITQVTGHWEASNGCGFYVEYSWWADGAKATFKLSMYSPEKTGLQILVHSQHVGRMKEIRPLLLNDECFRQVRDASKALVNSSL
jgi:hypothetical protein